MLKLSANWYDNNFFTQMSDWVPEYIETIKIEFWSSELIQTTITFYSDVWLSPVIYLDARNWILNLYANSNDNNFLLGCPIEYRNISKRSKLNVEAMSKFKRQSLFYSDVWLSPVICRDARNWRPKLWANSNDNNFLLGCLDESRNISRHLKLKTTALCKFKRL